ncbi:hypothetical protein O206_12695 [Ochrobactrum sp. EGD-AQ16]|nr:hypothetical protein O206_12695 [Ochrobactrum sp. EGD-AQ16]
MEPLYLFVLKHYPAQIRTALLLEMLWDKLIRAA